MNFINKLKTDKSFRTTVIIIFISAVLIYGNSGDKKEIAYKTFEDCNSYNSVLNWCTFGINTGWSFEDTGKHLGCLSEDDKVKCQGNGCFIGYARTTGFNHDVCIPYGSDGWEVYNPESCLNCHNAMDSNNRFMCRACDPDIGETKEDTKCSTSLQKSLAGFLYPKYFDNCKTAFMVIAIGSGFIALMFLMMAL